MHAIAYTYQAETLCAAHAAIAALRILPDRHEIADATIGRLSRAAIDAEHGQYSDASRAEIAHYILAELAPLAEVADWQDLYTFDSDDFPKPVDWDSLADSDYCETCGESLTGGDSRDVVYARAEGAQRALESVSLEISQDLAESRVIDLAFGITPDPDAISVRIAEIIGAYLDASRQGDTCPDSIPTLTYSGMPSLATLIP